MVMLIGLLSRSKVSGKVRTVVWFVYISEAFKGVEIKYGAVSVTFKVKLLSTKLNPSDNYTSIVWIP
jgi:hypothetical protein